MRTDGYQHATPSDSALRGAGIDCIQGVLVNPELVIANHQIACFQRRQRPPLCCAGHLGFVVNWRRMRRTSSRSMFHLETLFIATIFLHQEFAPEWFEGCAYYALGFSNLGSAMDTKRSELTS